MPNTSASGGYLAPLDAAGVPPEDTAFEDQLSALVVGVVGLAAQMVRPRWQPIPPKQPEAGVNWCAIGITGVDQDANAAIVHHSVSGVGYDEMQRHELVSILASFYGPSAYGNAALFRDGLSIDQNLAVIRSQGMGFYDVGAVVSLPALQNQIWVRRVDLPFRVKRAVIRTFPVLDITSAGGTIQTDAPHVQIFSTP